MTHTRTTAALVGVSVFMLALTGCGPSPAVSASAGAEGSAYDAFAEMPADDRTAAIVAAAEEEGQVVVYLRSDDVFGEIEAAFEAEYDVDLVLLNPGTTQVVQQQIFEQAAAGRIEADVVETYSHELNLMYAEEGVVAPIPEFLGEAAPDQDLVSEHAIETFQYPFLPVWNVDAVTGADVPTSIRDFGDPFWAGRTVLVTNYHPWYLTVFQALTQNQGMSVTEFEELMTTIAANASTADSSNPASAGIASGQYYGGPNIALVAPQRLTGAPVAYEPTIEQVPLVPAGIGLMQEAPHPAAALLFSMWYLDEGATILAAEQYVEQNAAETDLLDVEKVRPDLTDLTSERLNEWRIAYDNLLKGTEPILPDYVRGG